MVNIKPMPVLNNDNPVVNCACVIHGSMYDWIYVEKLHSMLQRNFSYPIKLHVFTEHDRKVPGTMIKHELEAWPGIDGPKRAWWYKMQMFNPQHFSGQLLYFDLDVVIVKNLDWILDLDPSYFWGIRDFRYLWRQNWQGINSSMMYWNTDLFSNIWKNFTATPILDVTRRFPGDQDFLTASIPQEKLQFFDQNLIKSWRWQIDNGGINMKTRQSIMPGAGTVLPPSTCVVVFHGNPKQHMVELNSVTQCWH